MPILVCEISRNVQNFSVKDAPHSERPIKIDDDHIKLIITLIEKKLHQTTREIGEILNISKSSVENYLQAWLQESLRYLDIPHKLNAKNLIDRISICDLLLKRNKNDSFFKQMVLDDEK